MKRLQQHLQGVATLDLHARRGLPRQRRRRLLEHELRDNVAELAGAFHDRGTPFIRIAELLHLSARTLRYWLAGTRIDQPVLLPLGRPTLRSTSEQRRAVIAVLDESGPATGLPALQDCFPDMPRAELDDLLRLYRRAWQHRHQHAPHVLHWQVPGAVWAMDYSEAPAPIDGRYRYLLAIRDLASGQQLSWLPVSHANSLEAVLALSSLFALHGPPLVLKTDNGSPFCADLTRWYLDQSGVIPLFSPPYTPRYNGAIEAGIGSLKMRTERHAAWLGHPGYWTMDDIAYALADANATSRPKGPRGPTADQSWTARNMLTNEQRQRFQETVKRYREEILASEDLTQEERMSTSKDRHVGREAIRRALDEHGYLLFRRRRIPLPICRQKAARDT